MSNIDTTKQAKEQYQDRDTAPKDGTMVCLLVDYSGDGAAPLDDAKTGWTIGYNTLVDTGDDEWIMVGWDWCQDCYCQGRGEVIGWAPFKPSISMAAEITRLTAALAQSRAETQAALAGRVKVKPLVWECLSSKFDGGREHFGTGVFGHWYGVKREKNRSWRVAHHIGNSVVEVGHFESLEAAKAAAQADYEARILAAIQPDTSKMALVRELVAILRAVDEHHGLECIPDTEYVGKLRAALALITTQEETRHD